MNCKTCIAKLEEYSDSCNKTDCQHPLMKIKRLEGALTGGSADLRDYVIVQRPGKVPERKGPLVDKKHIEDMLLELYQHYPDCTCSVIKLPVDSYPQSGREWLYMYCNK